MIVEWCRMMCKVNGEYVYHFFSIVSLPWIVELGVLFFFWDQLGDAMYVNWSLRVLESKVWQIEMIFEGHLPMFNVVYLETKESG